MNPQWLCSCGTQFLAQQTFDAHRLKNKVACRESNTVSSPYRSNHFLSKSQISVTNQLVAIFGDLKHKEEVYLHFKQHGVLVDSYFDNKHQAWFVVNKHPELVPEPDQPSQQPSYHTLGTVFEFAYQTDLAFRFDYLSWLPGFLELAPKLER